MRFDWQTEEEDWDEGPREERAEAAVANNRFSRLGIILVTLLIIGAAVFYFSQLAENQVDNTTTSLSSDLLATYELLNTAVYQNDPELFTTFLSNRNTYSRQLPLDLFRSGYFLDRPFLHLSAQDISPGQPPRVELSPDLTRAEVVSLQAYHLNDDPQAGLIWLERLTLFRRADDGWQLTRWPIDESFWGETEEVQVGLLRAEFPARDEETGRRLAQDIGWLLGEICGDAAINCPPNFRLKMLLVPYGQNLLEMNRNYRTLPLSSGYDAYRVFLPAPTLAGKPIDEAGYQVFYEGYAAWIAAVLVQHYSQIRPVTIDVTADFLAQWQLTPPPTPLLPGPVLEGEKAPPGELVDGGASAGSVGASISSVTKQEIHFVCQGFSPPTWLAYSPSNDSWRTIPTPDNAPALAQLLQQAGARSRFAPEGQGSLIRRPFYMGTIQSWHSFLWLGGLTNLLETADNPDLYLADARHQMPDRDYLLFYPFDGQGNPFLANTADCLNGDCQLEPLEGLPTWSPSGEQTLLTIYEEDRTPQLFQGDGQGRPLEPIQPLTGGYSPHWVDETTFLYVGEDGREIFNGRFEAALPANDAFQSTALTGLELLENEIITHLTTHPARPVEIFIVTANPELQLETFRGFNLETMTLETLLAPAGLEFSLPVYVSEDGRFLTVLTFESGTLSGGWYVHIINLDPEPNERQSWQTRTGSAYFDWSADGDWLLLAENDALRLIAPHLNFEERRIPHELGCHTVGWAERP